MKRQLAVAVVFLSVCKTAALARAETRFTIVDASPTSWVTHGLDDYTITPSDGWTFNVSHFFSTNAILVSLDYKSFDVPVFNWRMVFSGPRESLLTPGYYPDFSRIPYDGDRPRLRFSSTGRADGYATGHFEVLEVTYGPNKTILSFAADFTHYGELSPDNYAVVQVRYNSTVPEPSTYLMATIGIVALLFARRRQLIGTSQPRN